MAYRLACAWPNMHAPAQANSLLAALNPVLAFISGSEAAKELEKIDVLAADAAKTAGSKVRVALVTHMVQAVVLAQCIALAHRVGGVAQCRPCFVMLMAGPSLACSMPR